MTERNDLSPDFIAAQKKRLVALRNDLLGAQTNARDELNVGQEDGAEAVEYEDVAQSLDYKEVLQARHDVDLPRLANVDRALVKIELGTYGLSDQSGRAIPKNRLEALPEAVLTVEEAAAKE